MNGSLISAMYAISSGSLINPLDHTVLNTQYYDFYVAKTSKVLEIGAYVQYANLDKL